MRVFLDCPPQMSQGIFRVVNAMKANLPLGVTLSSLEEADLVVLHVVGVQNFSPTTIPEQIQAIRERGQRYAIMQYCLRTTENPTPDFWAPIWQDSCCTWSYYDIGAFVGAANFWCKAKVYHAPLGVDQDVFRINEHAPKIFTIGTSGWVAETEGVREANAAVEAVGGYQWHLGPDLGLGPRAAWGTKLSDAAVAQRWNECEYVAGLRRVEGFELVAWEGLLCGARPIVFDAPHYRRWFGDLAEYVPEGTTEEVTAALTALFRGPYRPVTGVELKAAAVITNWPLLLAGFWKRVVVK
jgi:hypothetical protein